MQNQTTPFFRPFKNRLLENKHQIYEITPELYKRMKPFERKIVTIGYHQGYLIPSTYDSGYILTKKLPFAEIEEADWNIVLADAGILCTILPVKVPFGIYIDTSIPNHLVKTNNPEWMQATEDFWEQTIKYDNIIDLYCSQLFYDEIEECYQPKRQWMYERIKQINLLTIKTEKETIPLAQEIYIQTKLPEKAYDDCIHMAHALLKGCAVILTWNFTHMVRPETVAALKEIIRKYRYNEIEILSPTDFLLGGPEWTQQ
jgi:hypothetical protein